MRRKLFTICFITLLALSVCRTTDIKAALKDDDWDFEKIITKTESGFKYFAYPSKNGKEAWLYRISGDFLKKDVTLSIPKTINGKKVTHLGEALQTDIDPFNILMRPVYFNGYSHYTNRIKKVILPDTVEVIEPCTFVGFHKMETIKIPKNVTKIDGNTFYECWHLKKVILPEKLKELDPMAFSSCPDLKKLQLSSKNKKFKIKSGRFLITRKNNALVFAAAGGEILKIPNGIKTIKKNACNNITPVVHIPASVRKRGYKLRQRCAKRNDG